MALRAKLAGKLASNATEKIAGRPGGFSRFLGSKTFATAAIGTGVMSSMLGSNVIEGDENTYGLQQAFLEGALNDPYADVAVVGERVNLLNANLVNNVLPVGDATRNAYNLQYLNRTSFKNLEAERSLDNWRIPSSGNFDQAGKSVRRIAQGNIDRGFSERRWPSTGYPYRNPATTRVNPDEGAIVLGAHNLYRGGR